MLLTTKIIKSYFRPEVFSIFFLGMASGIPLALILSTLKVLLVDKNFDLATIGFFSIAALPYSIKFLWAPLLDSLKIPYLTKKLGRRRSWIILSQILLFFTIAILGFFGSQGNLLMIIIFATIVTTISATQDIAVDAYRIESVKEEDQGIAVTMYVYGYRIGMLISGAGALILSETISWDKVYYFIALTMLIGVVTVLLIKEKLVIKVKNEESFISWFKDYVIKPLADFVQRPHWIVIFLFIVCFKLCDVFAGALTLPFLLDIEFTKFEIASIVKTFGLFATLFGIFLGGVIIKWLGLVRSLWIAVILQMLSNMAFYFQSLIGHDITSLYAVIFIENFSGGIGDAVFVAYLSSLCNVAFTATQYAVLVSFATMGRTLFAATTGVFAEYLGWSYFFLLSTAVALPSIIFLYLITRRTK